MNDNLHENDLSAPGWKLRCSYGAPPLKGEARLPRINSDDCYKLPQSPTVTAPSEREPFGYRALILMIIQWALLAAAKSRLMASSLA